MRQVPYGEPRDGGIILIIIKPVMLILIMVFAIMCFITSLELNKLSTAVLTTFTELTASSVLMIPMLITFVGLYGTYHMHKSIMIIFFGLVMLHGLFCASFLTFSLTNDCFTSTLNNSIVDMQQRMANYDRRDFGDIGDPEKLRQIDNDLWRKYEDTWAIDRMQKGLTCCGLTDKHDWNHVFGTDDPLTQNMYPKSCCKKPIPNDNAKGGREIYCQVEDNIYQEGCKDTVEASFRSLLVYMGVLCGLQVMMMLGAHVISFKVQDPAERPKNPAEIAWMQFVNAQYKSDLKTRSKSCVV